jgi:hypothetical protein
MTPLSRRVFPVPQNLHQCSVENALNVERKTALVGELGLG